MISIIIPVYNVEKYLDECLQSVVSQTCTDWECIIVDDGSTDRSPEICDEWAERDKRFVVIHKENGGVSSARNIGIEHSIGEYICFIDSDDWVAPDYLWHLRQGIKDDNVDMVVTGTIHEKNKPEIHSSDREIRLNISPEYIQSFIDHVGLFYGPCSILYKASIIKSHRIKFPLELSFGEDTTFVFSYLRKVNDVIIRPFADYHYRILDGPSLSNRFGEEKTFQRYDLWKMRQQFYLDYGMWNQVSQANMYRELWAIAYDGIFSVPNPSRSYLKELLHIPEIGDLKNWETLFEVPKYIKKGIEHRAYVFFYLLCKLIAK